MMVDALGGHGVNGLRLQNMQLRRERIIASARKIIFRDGLESLSLRRMAEEAGITVPTLYNLIGSRDHIIAALCDDALDELDRRLDALDAHTSGLMRAEAIVVLSAKLFCGEPKVYRPVVQAVEYQALQRGATPRGIRALARCASLQAEACRLAARDGALRGRLDPDLLGEQILDLYRVAMRRWVMKDLDDLGFLDYALQGLFVCLLADATEQAAPMIRLRLSEIQKRLAARKKTKKK
jgi:AcrR family transcriptional regulator